MIVLCDLDHTISNAGWRDKYLGDWDYYHSLLIRDLPIQEVIQVVWSLQDLGANIFGLTARPSKWRTLTEEWLRDVAGICFQDILMRDDDGFHPSAEMKWRLVLERWPNFPNTNDTFILLEDRDDVCQKFYAAGITVLQVHARKGSYDKEDASVVRQKSTAEETRQP